MYAYIDEDGTHKAATILSQADASSQLELTTGKRIKIKNNQILFTFDQPNPIELTDKAQALAREIDVDFLWELLPQAEFLGIDFAPEYFGGKPTAIEKAALLMALHAHPAIFNRKGKGLYKPATADMLATVKAALEKKAREQARCDEMVSELIAGTLPDEIKAACPGIAFKPDKNSWAWKALTAAAKHLDTHPTRLLMLRGAFNSHYALHMSRFLAEQFPQGAGHKLNVLPAFTTAQLPTAQVKAFSIDDSSTTEIDDALSVTHLGDGCIEIGIHIAAPALLITPNSPLDKLARARMSTVYMPGEKITMLPDAAVQAFSLDEGKLCPAASLYCTFDASFTLLATRSIAELVPIAANLRHDVLEEHIHIADIEAEALPEDIPFRHELMVLYRLRTALSAQREAVRGKPENNNRTDFSFAVQWQEPGIVDTAQVTISTRKRGSPLDAIVSEMMILANSTWAGWMAKLGVPGVFRGQRFGKVKMSTVPIAHESIGVPYYGWFTSPLRRYSDLVNQTQLLACIQYGTLAALQAPYKAKDVDLFAIVGAFEERYTSYASHQNNMERYWCLRWLSQGQGIGRYDAVVVRPDTVRLKQVPLYIPISQIPDGARGRPVVVDIMSWDELDLSVQARYVGEGMNQNNEAAEFENDILDNELSDNELIVTSALTLPELTEVDAPA